MSGLPFGPEKKTTPDGDKSIRNRAADMKAAPLAYAVLTSGDDIDKNRAAAMKRTGYIVSGDYQSASRRRRSRWRVRARRRFLGTGTTVSTPVRSFESGFQQ